MAMGSSIIPSARYKDAPAAIEWLCRVFGFTKHAVYEGRNNTVAHAELTLHGGMFMLGSDSNESPYPQAMSHPGDLGGRVTSPFYVLVDDCGVVFERARASGAEVLQPLRTMDYGGRAFTVRDPEGYVWSAGEYDPWNAMTEQGSQA